MADRFDCAANFGYLFNWLFMGRRRIRWNGNAPDTIATRSQILSLAERLDRHEKFSDFAVLITSQRKPESDHHTSEFFNSKKKSSRRAAALSSNLKLKLKAQI